MRAGERIRLRAAMTRASRYRYCTVVVPPVEDPEPQEPFCDQLQAGLRALPAGATRGLPFDPSQIAATTRTERVRVHWLATAGHLTPDVTAGAGDDGAPVGEERADVEFATDRFVPERLPPEGLLVDLYAVPRDGRGGATWAHRVIRLLPAR